MNYVIAFFSYFITNQILKEMFGRNNRNKLRKILSIIVYFLFVLNAVEIRYSHCVFPVMVFLGMLILMLNYEIPLKKCLWRIFKIYIVTVALYVVVLLIVSPLGAENEVFIIFSVIHYLTLKAYNRILSSSYKESVLLYIAVPSIFIGLIVYIAYGVELTGYQRMLVLFSLITVALLIIAFYNDYAKQYEIMSERKVLEEQSYAYKRQVELIVENEQAIRRVRHDMKNHIFMIKQMLQSGSYDKLESYVDRIEEGALLNVDSQDTGNFEFDAMLANKISYIQSKGIRIEKKVLIPEKLQVDGFDISVIVGNLLDNAMYAVQNLTQESKWIKFYAVYNRNVLNIIVSNPYEGTIIFNQDHIPETTKQNKYMHGIGLKSVKSAVEKYRGVFDITAESNLFRIEVGLYFGNEVI